MLFKKWLWKIPFFKKMALKKTKAELIAIKNNFKEGDFNDNKIKSLHNILNNSLIEFSEDFIKDAVDKISTHTKTSDVANKLIKNKIIKKSLLERKNDVFITGTHHYFSEWHSNEESVSSFINQMCYFISINVKLIEIDTIVIKSEDDEKINFEDKDFIESLLYRLLVEDVASISLFYLERQYEQ